MGRAGPFADWRNHAVIMASFSFPNPEELFFQRLKKAILKFVWNDKTAKIKYLV